MKKSKTRRIENIKFPNRSITLNIFKFCENCNCVRKHNEFLRYVRSGNDDPFSEAVNEDLCACCKCLKCGKFEHYKDREKYIDMIKNQ